MRCSISLFLGILNLITFSSFSQSLKLVPPIGHTGRIVSVQFSLDGKKIISSGFDGTTKIWDFSTGKLIDDFTESSSMSTFSPDMRKIFTAGIDTVKIWDLSTQKVIHSLPLRWVNKIKFTPDGKYILIYEYDEVKGRYNKMEVWNTDSGSLSYRIKKHGYPLFSPDNKLLAIQNQSIHIYDVESGELKQVLTVPESELSISYDFSPDSKKLVGAISDKTIRIWDVINGNLLNTLSGHSEDIKSVRFSHNGNMIVSTSSQPVFGRFQDNFNPQRSIKVWDVSSGVVLQKIKPRVEGRLRRGDPNISAQFSYNDKIIITQGYDGTNLWDISDGKLLHSYDSYLSVPSPDEDNIALVYEDRTINIRDISSGRFIRNIKGHSKNVKDATLSPDGNLMAYLSEKSIQIWELSSNTIKLRILDRFKKWNFINFNSDGSKLFCTGYGNYFKALDVSTGNSLYEIKEPVNINKNNSIIINRVHQNSDSIKLWDAESGELISSFQRDEIFGENSRIANAFVDRHGDKVVFRENSLYGDSTQRLQVRKISTGKVIAQLDGGMFWTNSIDISADGRLMVLVNRFDKNNHIFAIIDLESEKIIKKVNYKYWDRNYYLQFSPDDSKIIITTLKGTFVVSTAQPEKVIYYLEGTGFLDFTSGGTQFVSMDFNFVKYSLSRRDNNLIKIWDFKSGELIDEFKIKKHFETINYEQNLILTNINSQLTLYNLSDKTELFTRIQIDSIDWVITDPEGRFDASGNAMNLMHFVMSDEVIEFNQLKDRYYEPGLLQKILGHSQEPLRKSKGLNKIELHPNFDLIHPLHNKGKLGIKLTNREGGIGKVKIWINGKEVETDARGKKIKPDEKELTINYTIKGHPYLKPGELNTIEVKAYNKEEYLVSRGKKIYYDADGKKEEPKLYALIAGSSNYRGEALDLSYAAKDAEDFAHTIGLVGNKFFGVDKLDIRLLTTQQEDFTQWPTKENIEKTFKEISTTANPFDVFVVYLSGHGTNYGGSEGDFYYLTSDAASGTLTDPVVRKQVAISSEEFTEYFKWVPALKQVMILDACHSGQLAEDLLAKRETRSSSEVRALERMKDRTGMYILAGSAADAVSYETSVYGQGLLTYSLLFGMKGAALRENKFVDVMKLFQFAADKVPELARNIGGIQKPEVRVPYGGQSFDIGLVTEEEQSQIILPSPKPLFLRSGFFDEVTMGDPLRLTDLIDESLQDIQAKSVESKLIFIHANRFSDAYYIRGRYKREGDNYVVITNLLKGDDLITSFEVEGANANEIANKIVAKVIDDIE